MYIPLYIYTYNYACLDIRTEQYRTIQYITKSITLNNLIPGSARPVPSRNFL